MPEITILLLGIISVILLILVLITRKDIQELKSISNQNPLAQFINQTLQGMHQRLDQTHKMLGDQLQNTHGQMSNTLNNLANMMGNVGKELGGVKEIGGQIAKFQEFLNSPKLRGNLGEQILYDSLEKLLPVENYKKQYKFSSGPTVDALILSDKGNIPVDSKFPMEVYQRVVIEQEDVTQKATKGEFERAVKKYIDDIANKYIHTEEGTTDFAILYVPAETVYYEIVHGEYSILPYAMDKKVVIVSPHLFYHVLRVLLMGLERAKIAKDVEKVWTALNSITQEFGRFGKQLEVVNRHITNAKNGIDTLSQEYAHFEQKLDNTRNLR